jgi:flagellar biosynthesis protein FliR
MITLSTGELEAWIAQALWPFVRIGSCLMVAPIFTTESVPARIRVVLAGAITLLVAPLVSVPAVAPFAAAGIVITAQQVVIGVALGFCLQLAFDAVTLGGQLIANSMGLSFAMSVDPVRGVSTPAVGQLYTIFVTLVFLALDGHLRIVEVLVDGFRTLPLGMQGLGTDGLWQLVSWGAQLFSGALAIALPGITALLIVNLAFGMISRAAPSLNLMSVGFPISLSFGLLVLVVSVPTLASAFDTLMQAAFDRVVALEGGR